ncbi:hypothetical protein LCGC14_1230540 [marine sediment metagenome]|uniref:Uncharacterized protein n=1 Tax=marine sediment metagenome TaxID=412755 RepID=A0A0F9L8M1_9ZZZZ
MRWKVKEPKDGDLRVRESRFLLFPRLIRGERRWLEFASWTQVRRFDQATCFYEWRDIAWAD